VLTKPRHAGVISRCRPIWYSSSSLTSSISWRTDLHPFIRSSLCSVQHLHIGEVRGDVVVPVSFLLIARGCILLLVVAPFLLLSERSPSGSSDVSYYHVHIISFCFEMMTCPANTIPFRTLQMHLPGSFSRFPLTRSFHHPHIRLLLPLQ